jgi:hypothetical protein
LPATARIALLYLMKLHALLFIGLLPFLSSSYGQPKGFKKLFNGVDLTGWWGLSTENPASWINLPKNELEKKQEDSLTDINKHWKVEGGILVNDGHGLYLTTLENFSDFTLILDYNTVAQADSGVYLRGYPQVQIWDTTESGGKWRYGAKDGSGGLWNNRPKEGWSPLVHADLPFGEWNRLKIQMVGDKVSVWLNDKLVVDQSTLLNYWKKSGPILPSGPIQLQTHGGEIRWRNIFIKEIGS